MVFRFKRRVCRVPCVVQAGNNRDALARTLYRQLFDWLRDAINTELAAAVPASDEGAGWAGRGEQSLSIGLLDIFGFESFAVLDRARRCWRSANRQEKSAL